MITQITVEQDKPSSDGLVPFDEIKRGACFLYGNTVWKKLRYGYCNSNYSAITLHGNLYRGVFSTERVRPIKSLKLVYTI